MGERPLDVPLVLRLERELDRVVRVADLRVRPEEQLREHRQGRVQVLGDRPLTLARVDYAQEVGRDGEAVTQGLELLLDRKSTRLNSSHVAISYAVFCLKK